MGKKILTVTMIVYVALLVAAGWPVNATELILRKVSSGASYLLGYVKILPGLKLFYFPYPYDEKMAGGCIQIKGYPSPPGSKPILLYQTPNGCAPKTIHLFADTYEVMYFRFLEEISQLRRPYDVEVENPFRPPAGYLISSREMTMHQAIGDYFCHSGLEKSQGLASVGTAWREDTVSFRTGRRKSEYMLLTDWDCVRNTLTYLGWRSRIHQGRLKRFLEDLPQ